MKKIMILTAERTGTGHKSAANAIEQKLNLLGYETKQIDCFNLMGKKGQILENSYIPITTKQPYVFYISYQFSQIFPNAIHSLVYANFRKRFKKEITEFKPDLIISVHSLFTKSISYFLKKEELDIPFYINVIDLVKPPKVWFDKKANVLFVPTEDVKQKYIKKGIDESRLIVSGFPIRTDIIKRKTPKTVDNKVNILLVNPSVKLSKNIKFTQEVSKIKNTTVTVICGRDERMYKVLTKLQNSGKIDKDVKIYSFVKNMNEFLENAHILLAKAGPNMILEGARSATAIVVTGHIKGQENKNYEYVVKNDFGFKCENPEKIYSMINEFIQKGKLQNCLENVLKAECNDGAEIIADYIHKKIKG